MNATQSSNPEVELKPGSILTPTRTIADVINDLDIASNKPASSNTNEQQQEKKKETTTISIRQNVQQQQSVPKRTCRAPVSRKFAHPCICNQQNYHKNHQGDPNNTSQLPAAAYTPPLHLYDSATKKCLPTSRTRDMLLKECRFNVASPYPLPHQLYHGTPCVYDDLICDARRNRCICKPSLHLYYNSNSSAFGCAPITTDLRCKTGYIYNVISKDCQKIFDVSELPPTFTTGVSATQFSFVTIVLIWILLLILIVTAKLRKLRSSNMCRGRSDRSTHRQGSLRHQNQSSATAWLHPFIAAVNGHNHLNQHRTTIDRNPQGLDEHGNFNDTDFFLANGTGRIDELYPDGPFTGSQHSLNNPPPKFEEIYPGCPNNQQRVETPPASNEDLPSYDEAMKLQNTACLPDHANQKNST